MAEHESTQARHVLADAGASLQKIYDDIGAWMERNAATIHETLDRQLAPICRYCGDSGVNTHGKPCRCPLGRTLPGLVSAIKEVRQRVCVTCGGQGFIGDGGYIVCPVCGPGLGVRP